MEFFVPVGRPVQVTLLFRLALYSSLHQHSRRDFGVSGETGALDRNLKELENKCFSFSVSEILEKKVKRK